MMHYARFRLLVLLAVLAGLGAFAHVADAQVYNRFGPANGILVGDTSTYNTTAADSSDVISLWSGTCNASSFLRGDGSCAAATTAPAGADTQVQFNDAGAFGADAGLTYSGGELSVSAGVLTASVYGIGGLSIAADVGNLSLDAPNNVDVTVSNQFTVIANATNGLTFGTTGTVFGSATGGPQGVGTINAEGLYIDGVAVGTGSGSVTSVGLTMPSGFSVGGSPVTTSGTLAVSTTLNGPLRGNGTGFTTGNIALGSEVSGTLPVANGGTGVTSSTGTGSVVLSASPALTGSPTVGGQAVCLADGTNCPSAGGAIVCNAACNISSLAVGGQAIVYKPSATSRASTTTFTADPVLQFTNVPVNTKYSIEVYVDWRQGGATTNGIRARLFGTNSNSKYVCRTTTNTTSGSVAEVANGSGIQNFVNFTLTSGGGADMHMTCSGMVTTFTGTATIEYQWAQNTSDATNTSVEADSWIRVTRVL